MKRIRKISVVLFGAFILVSASFSLFLGTDCLTRDKIPWHMQSKANEESLSLYYTIHYPMFDRRPVMAQIDQSIKPQVIIMINAWGVPYDESVLEKEFSLFSNIPHSFALHYRMTNRTKHAEMVELRKDSTNAIFLFGGDSLEYGRSAYLPKLGYSEMLFCQNCEDVMMLKNLDSIITDASFAAVAWTTQDSRFGSEKNLKQNLEQIADLAKKHPDVRFVVQGTHAPILGPQELKRKYYTHWVPAVVLNP